MGKFDKFNKEMSTDEIRKSIQEASSRNAEVPAGNYVGKIEKMELGETKDGRPMLKVQFRITQGDHKKKCLFMNRVVAGTRNDMGMIASVEGWINKLLDDGDVPLAFNGNYSEFAEDIMDCAEVIDGVTLGISYNPDDFNSISVDKFLD